MERNEFGYIGNYRNDGLSFGEPGMIEVRHCGICGSLCLITRNINGPTGFAESIAGKKHLHDVFECPYYKQEWHKTSIKLIIERNNTASKRIKELIELDLDELLESNIEK